ncbi:MAG: ATPase, T2SS/T4P/T4SS family [Clostridia bacterium]|nr:ATPase, T2SS/T4P/T4SS family [Clostridia bacterium]
MWQSWCEMILNPYEKELKEVDKYLYKNENNKYNKKNILDIQKYIVDNYIEYIKLENYELIRKKIEEYIYRNNKNADKEDIDKIKELIINKMFGYHILQKYIDNKNISDIRAVKYDLIYIKEYGKWKKINERFEDEDEFYEYVRYCVLKNNANINYDKPIVIVSDKKYNLRIEAGIFPVNAKYPSLTIRIHRHNLDITLETLFLKQDMFNGNIYSLLINIIKNEKNIILCGKGGSGKTSLLRALIDKIPDDKSIVSNEETIELYIENKNIIQREALTNREKSKQISLDTLARHSLVMASDVIIIGELKSDESSVFFDSLATGHMGITTLHCNSVYTSIDRLNLLIKKDVKYQQYKEEYINKILASNIDYIVFLKDYKINQIAYVEFNNELQKVEINIIYEYKKLDNNDQKYLINNIGIFEKSYNKESDI